MDLFYFSGHSSIPSRDRSSVTGRSTESIPGGSDDSWQPSAAAASAAPLSLPAALSAAGSKSYDYLLKVSKIFLKFIVIIIIWQKVKHCNVLFFIDIIQETDKLVTEIQQKFNLF